MIHQLRRILGHPLIRAAYIIFLVAIAVFYLIRWGRNLPALIGQVRWSWVGLALIIACLSALLYSYIQHDIYRQLGVRLSYRAVFRIVSVSQLGKYLPGKLLFFGNFYLFSRQAGIETLQIGTNFAISMVLWLMTAALCSLPVLSLLQPALRYSVLVLPLLLAVLIHPRSLRGLARLIDHNEHLHRLWVRLAGDESGPEAMWTALHPSFYLRAAFLYLLTWTLAGAGAYFCLRAFIPLGVDIYPLVLAPVALGTIGGFVALFAPVGLGVREGIGALVLTPVLGADTALLGLVLLRGVTVTVDLTLAFLSLLTGRRRAGPER